jgi:hypothetical protein
VRDGIGESPELLERVRELTPAPIIALLTGGELELLIAAFAAGADDSIVEPQHAGGAVRVTYAEAFLGEALRAGLLAPIRYRS